MMSLSIFKVTLSIVLFGFAITSAKKVVIKSLDIKMKPNDYFGTIAKRVTPAGGISVILPLKRPFDDRFQVKSNIYVASMSFITDRVIRICDDIAEQENSSVLKPVYDRIEPKKLFPDVCPIPFRNWTVNNMIVDSSYFSSFGFLAFGSFRGFIEFGHPNEDPVINVDVSGHIPFW